MKKNQLKILETKLDAQQSYIQELESRLNTSSTQTADIKNILAKTHEQIKTLNGELNDLLNFILMLEEEKLSTKSKGVLSLQDYMHSLAITEDKNLLFGVNIDQKFIQNRSIPTIKYYLYTFDCFFQEEHQLQSLKIYQKKDIALVVETLIEYIKLFFKNQATPIKGLIEINPAQSLFPQSKHLTIKYYGNYSIEEEIQSFIKLYSQKD
ncbi:hypothetical protein BKH46_02780 [Helicobacter sp. 12S02634-8]|uniref:hypothetical protein n=1 Tax=Helicobacter sp. 12S02634-8 TaxID=1476199 RepID=UPI000BA79D6B|nr:hypothetical protein [Helicobacter sp. 12S02634-8]PAF47780.1 hypothetical protein BKH46_02780 [Helicobacter sp. 12S02634-8]